MTQEGEARARDILIVDDEADIRMAITGILEDEGYSSRSAGNSTQALEEIDRHIVGPLLEALAERGDYRMLVSPDHPTPVRTKTHSHGFVPWAICGAGAPVDASKTYDEVTAGESSLGFEAGWRMMGEVFLK